MRTLNSSQEHLALALFDGGAYLDKRRSPEGKGFRLKLHEKNPDAPLSPFYLNLRTANHPTKPGPLTSEIIDEIGQQLFELASTANLEYTIVGGVPNAGDPFADAYAEAARKAGRTVRVVRLKKEEGEGGRRVTAVVGDRFALVDAVLLIDDLITEADSKLEAIDSVKARKLAVAGVVVLVDREQGGADQLKRSGYPFHAVFTISELLRCYVKSGRITVDEEREVLTYIGKA